MADGVAERFQRAAERMRQNGSLKLSNEDKLELYSLFKQANEGDCCNQRPDGWFDFTGKAKWDCWNTLLGMSKSDAMTKYISAVSRLDPEWETSPLESDSQISDRGDGSVGHAVSTLAGCDTEEALTDDKKTMFDWCKEGNEKKLRSLLSDTNVNQTDQEGMGLLHWACDRGNLNTVKLLVKRGADVNIEDTDNQTPLHYAVSCDHHAVISYLLQVGFLSQDVIENQAPI